jgi:hypothetical protein
MPKSSAPLIAARCARLELSALFDHARGFRAENLRNQTLQQPVSVVLGLSRVAHAFMMREKMVWCSQRGVAQVNITVALFAQPGTTLMRPACNARIPARTTGGACVITQALTRLLVLLPAAVSLPSLSA